MMTNLLPIALAVALVLALIRCGGLTCRLNQEKRNRLASDAAWHLYCDTLRDMAVEAADERWSYAEEASRN